MPWQTGTLTQNVMTASHLGLPPLLLSSSASDDGEDTKPAGPAPRKVRTLPPLYGCVVLCLTPTPRRQV